MPGCRFESAAPEDEIVFGACEPGWDRTAAATVEEWIAFVQARGVRRVLCLLSPGQVSAHDRLLERYEDAFGADRVAHVPVTDHTLMEEATLGDVLSVLDAADDAGERIVVHCKAGIGRTGQALAAWLVHARGYDPEAAVETVSSRHRQPDEAVRSGNGTREELFALLAAVA